jgi:integrase
VDLPARTIRLDAGTTKNNDGREVSMTKEVHTLLTACVEGKQPEDYVFTRGKSNKRVQYFRRSWENACQRAGVPSLLIHDLRRTGARNLRRLGVDQKTIMAIGGWKTAGVFQRYNIVDANDLAEAARRLDEKEEKRKAETALAQSWAQYGHNSASAPRSDQPN